MSLIKTIDAGTGFVKAGFFGDTGSGKTTTAMKLAIGTRKFFNLPGPIVMFDTENGSPHLSKWVKAETGLDLLGVKSRSLDDLIATAHECVAMKASALIVDSATHCWQELNDTYLARVNDSRKAERMRPLDRLEFQHMAAIKAKWAVWTALYLNSPLHIIACGRLQNEWEWETNEKGKKELVKSGVRFQAEKQFGYESSLLVEMESEQILDGGKVTEIVHRAIVLKDRNVDPATSLIGKTKDQPDFEFFRPHVETLVTTKPPTSIDMTRETKIVVDEAGNGEWQREKRQREILCENLQAVLDVDGIGGTGADAKASRAKLLMECFGTASKIELEGMKSDLLRDGLAKVRVRLAEMKENKL